jgi:UDP-hydrolysing UDP-N-acetyl-D-glucosamine 2-epimerase
MVKKIKVCFYTTNRAEYSKLKPILKLLQNDKKIETYLIVSGSHLLKEYGESINQIKKDGIRIYEEVYSHVSGDDITKTPETIGLSLLKLSPIMKRIKPDIAFCGFDRFDMFPFAITCSMMNIYLVHLEGGEITGTLDEKIRHSISKLSNFHFVSTEDAKKNLIRMGEYPENIIVTGCPRYDDLIKIKPDHCIFQKFKVEENNFLIFCYHPVSSSLEKSLEEMEIMFHCFQELKDNIIMIKPNIDFGNEKLREYFSLIENKDNIQVYSHIDIDEFSVLMSKCSCIIGNSSSGVREACVFGTPVLNIGNRQNFRIPESLKNIVTLKNFTKNTFLENLNQMSNKNFEKSFYFGDGKASEKILEIIKNIDFTKTEKTISYSQNGV